MNMLILIKKIKSNYYAEACNEWRSSDGRVAEASASGAVDSGWITSRVKPMRDAFKL